MEFSEFSEPPEDHRFSSRSSPEIAARRSHSDRFRHDTRVFPPDVLEEVHGTAGGGVYSVVRCAGVVVGYALYRCIVMVYVLVLVLV